MPIAFVFGVPPAYEIMANFSGLHMDMWGEMEMVGTIMDRDVEMVPCETLDLNVPAQAEIVVEGRVKLNGRVPGRRSHLAVDVSPAASRERAGGRDHRDHHARRPADLSQSPDLPDTDHQPLPRLCHEAVLYNRLSEIGLDVKDVRFPTWGAALSCILQFDYPREGLVNDALMTAMGAPWLNTKLVVAVSPDTDLDDARRGLSRDRDALRSGARRHHRAEHARLALRPVRHAARRPVSVAHRRQDGHRRDRASRATTRTISNVPGRRTGAR